LHLIQKVNKKSLQIWKKPKGISKKEFSLFCPTLINYKDIDSYAEKIILLRLKTEGMSKKEQKSILDAYKDNFAREFLESATKKEVKKFLKNLKDYGDNAIRYFRLTRYIYIRGGGFYIDLEPRRLIEIENLLNFYNAKSNSFDSKEKYLDYISDSSHLKLPWETKEKYIEIIIRLLEEIRNYENKLKEPNKKISDYKNFQENILKDYIEELRKYRRELQEKENYQKSQDVEQIEEYIESFKNIYKFEDRPILLEKLSSLGLNALNDALKIKPNYPVGDDNEPTFTAAANIPDIECFYEKYNAICEVTMLTGRNQWYNEGQPVMRHLRDFENRNCKKDSYCLFIAPKLHRDTINTFWTAIKYEYEGKPQKIIPLSIGNFVEVLKILVKIKQKGKFLKHDELFRLYDEILESSNFVTNSNEWVENIPAIITSWQESFKL
jgi:hypothetical protein